MSGDEVKSEPITERWLDSVGYREIGDKMVSPYTGLDHLPMLAFETRDSGIDEELDSVEMYENQAAIGKEPLELIITTRKQLLAWHIAFDQPLKESQCNR